MNKIERNIGIHVRLKDGLLDVIQAVQQLQLPIAQSFFLNESGTYVDLSSDVIHAFLTQKKKLNFSYFVHAAYWSSLVKLQSKEFFSLKKEAEIAQDLQSDGIVIHIGATRARLTKREQVAYVAECVNELLHQVSHIKLLLENSPHAGRNFGGDITDFGLLLEHVEQKNRVNFCLDTAHAFVYGYDLVHDHVLKDFFQLISDSIGKQRIALLHLNDTPEACGSYIDKHGIAGDGLLGKKVLQSIMFSELCKDVPIILELSGSCSVEDEKQAMHRVKVWDTEFDKKGV